jgi:hypothetical protein
MKYHAAFQSRRVPSGSSARLVPAPFAAMCFSDTMCDLFLRSAMTCFSEVLRPVSQKCCDVDKINLDGINLGWN